MPESQWGVRLRAPRERCSAPRDRLSSTSVNGLPHRGGSPTLWRRNGSNPPASRPEARNASCSEDGNECSHPRRLYRRRQDAARLQPAETTCEESGWLHDRVSTAGTNALLPSKQPTLRAPRTARSGCERTSDI